MTQPPDRAFDRWSLFRWFISSGTLNVPQAAGPVAFSLLALSLTGDASRGAAIILEQIPFNPARSRTR